jgi:hypothetical protein
VVFSLILCRYAILCIHSKRLSIFSLAVSDGLESTFSGLKKKKKKAVSSHDIYSESYLYVCIYMLLLIKKKVFICCHQH